MQLRTPEGDLPDLKPSRRLALASIFTAGYALALTPPAESAIVTDAEGLIIEEPSYPAFGGFMLSAYVARPKGLGRRPAIIVANEIFGIHAYIKDTCRRLAKAGYVAIAPNYFQRAGDPSKLADIAAIRPLVDATGHAQVMGDTDATVDWLKAQRFVAGKKLGITGFCWGGAVTWMAVAANPAFRAGVAWYGRLVAPPAAAFGGEPGRAWPVDVAKNLRAPVLGLYAENDRGIPVADVETMRKALAANGNPTGSEIIVYPGAEHGFHADYRPQYNEAAAKDGWARMLAWFKKSGVA
jgi:carboxymethylenebutenolidase